MEWYYWLTWVYLVILILRILLTPFRISNMVKAGEKPETTGGLALVMLLNIVFALALYEVLSP